jgi:hypothetical protein
VIMAVVIVAPAALIAMFAGASGIQANAATTSSYAPTESGQMTYACSAGTLSGSTCTTTAPMNESVCLTLIGGAYGAAAGTCTYSYYAELVSGETCPKGGLLTPASQTSWAGHRDLHRHDDDKGSPLTSVTCSSSHQDTSRCVGGSQG